MRALTKKEVRMSTEPTEMKSRLVPLSFRLSRALGGYDGPQSLGGLWSLGGKDGPHSLGWKEDTCMLDGTCKPVLTYPQ
jgi:hypothetical protein